jgi:zinc D-Ala-D-Ala carboxypeptidase
MQLSEHFKLHEFTRSDTATRLGIDNQPSDEAIKNLAALCSNVLEPVRRTFGPVTVNSGFRCLELNRAIKSKDNSSHVRGEAADIEVSASNYDLACWIRDNLDTDQVILEFYTPGQPHSGWVHVSYSGKNRNQALTINKNGTTAGLFA